MPCSYALGNLLFHSLQGFHHTNINVTMWSKTNMMNRTTLTTLQSEPAAFATKVGNHYAEKKRTHILLTGTRLHGECHPFCDKTLGPRP